MESLAAGAGWSPAASHHPVHTGGQEAESDHDGEGGGHVQVGGHQDAYQNRTSCSRLPFGSEQEVSNSAS